MIHRIFLFIIFVWHFVNGKVSELIVSHPKDGYSYKIGEILNFTCIIDDIGDLSVLFRHDGIKAENGISHFPDKYIATKTTDKSTTTFKLVIKQLEWNDHGEWKCNHGGSSKSYNVVIIVPGSVQYIKAELDETSVDKRLLTDLSAQVLYGKGIKTNPYDLTRNTKVKLQCMTGCSFPKSSHKWSYNNFSNIPSRPILSAISTQSKCKIIPAGEGYNTESSVIIGCNDLNMVGNNEVTCNMQDSNDSKSVFILCPGGHKPWTLTNGEIIGLSIAVGLTALMLVLFFMSAKKIVNSYRYGSVVGGIRV